MCEGHTAFYLTGGFFVSADTEMTITKTPSWELVALRLVLKIVAAALLEYNWETGYYMEIHFPDWKPPSC